MYISDSKVFYKAKFDNKEIIFSGLIDNDCTLNSSELLSTLYANTDFHHLIQKTYLE